MKTAIYVIAAVVLTACAATPANPGLDSYVGRNVSTLISRLGPAAKQTSNGSDMVYGWVKVETVDGIVNGDEFQASQSAQGSSRFNASQCKVDATAEGAGLIKSLHTDGSCSRTIDLLRK
jgi:hypothetical protein